MKVYYLSFLALLLPVAAIAQKAKVKNDVNFIVLKDTTLKAAVYKIVDREVAKTDSNNLFKKGLGYISVHVTQYSERDTLISYYISPELFAFKNDTPDDLYPGYYSYLGDRLVLIYIDAFKNMATRVLTEKYKKRVREVVNNTLEKPKKVVFYDVNNKKAFTDKNFRIDYLNFHSGIYLYIFKHRPPLMVDE